ncbi:hypothetical protein [Phaeospirillum tilakii]|uniref:GDSL-like Lipase/Acylhydrolase family protein n=1 Tax=Phaeospirillum tilakii TaxID=741673 RepID=A0ABW5CD20_9PROT
MTAKIVSDSARAGRRAGWIAGALAFAGILALALFLVRFPVERTLIPQQIAPVANDGPGFRVGLSGVGRLIEGDDLRAPDVSGLELREDGRLLGPPHSLHADIADSGAGRYSHWRRGLVFSSSDNSDPRVNGRVYTYTGIARFPWWLGPIGLVCLVTAGWIGRVHLARFLAKCGMSSARMARFRAGFALVGINLAVLIAGLALVFGAGEAYLRLTQPFPSEHWPSRFDPAVGFLFEPDAEIRHTNHLDFWVAQRSNGLGFLDRTPPTPEQAAAGCHVALIGDSFVEAAQVPLADKVQILLEAMAARAMPAAGISVSAWGYSGTGQLNQIPFYDHYARSLHPKLIVLVFVANDFANNSSALEALRNGWDPDHSPRVQAVRAEDGTIRLQPIDPDWNRYLLPAKPGGAARNMLLPWSFFATWLQTQIAAMLPQAKTDPALATITQTLVARPRYRDLLREWVPTTVGALDEPFRREDFLPPVFQEAIDFTGFALDEFQRRAETDHARLVILATHSLRVHGDGPFHYLKRLADARSIPVIDQWDYIKAAGGDVGAANFRHDGHWTPAGHRWAAEALLAWMRDNPSWCAALPQKNREN